MIAFLLSTGSWLVNSKVGRIVAMVAGAILFILTFGAIQRRKGRKDAEADRLKATARKTEEARHAANEARRDLRDVDSTELDQRLRDRGL